MSAILLAFWRICIFRSGPEHIPGTNAFLATLLIADGLVSWTALAIQSTLPLPAEAVEQLSAEQLAALQDGFVLLSRVVVSLATTGALIWGMLTLMGLGRRVTKTLCAIYGTDIVLTSATTAALWLASLAGLLAAELAVLGAVFWNVGVLGFILHRAMNISMGFGVVAAVFVLMFTVAIGQVTISI